MININLIDYVKNNVKENFLLEYLEIIEDVFLSDINTIFYVFQINNITNNEIILFNDFLRIQTIKKESCILEFPNELNILIGENINLQQKSIKILKVKIIK